MSEEQRTGSHRPGPDGRSASRVDDYRVMVPVFEGPIDLLLYLIRKNELGIHEISLASIAQEYLEYVEIIKLIDLERAGDFIVIASELMKIKARSLFSAHRGEEDADGPDDTRSELIRYLLEYQKLGGAADKLAEKETDRRGVFPRGGERDRIVGQLESRPDEPDYMLFDLLGALRDVLASAPRTETHEVELLNITSEMKQREIMEVLGQRGSIEFAELVADQPRLIIVVTFIALLELIKQRRVVIRQVQQFGRITIHERTDDTVEDS